MSSPLRSWFGVCAVGAALVSCQGDPTKPLPAPFQLEGSLTALMDLGWDEARVVLSVADYSLSFVRRRARSTVVDAGAVEDIPLKVTYALNNEGPPRAGRVDLAEVLPSGPRAVVSRNVADDPRRSFPDIGRGTLYFSRAPQPNQLVSGDFHVTFVTGKEPASGHTVFGAFNAKVMP